jgi:hypothetical protein
MAAFITSVLKVGCEFKCQDMITITVTFCHIAVKLLQISIQRLVSHAVTVLYNNKFFWYISSLFQPLEL